MIALLSPYFQKSVPAWYRTSLEQLDNVVLTTVLLRIVSAIPEEKLPEFEAVLQLSDSGVLEAFLTHEVPGIEAIVKETLDDLQKEATEVIALLDA